MKENINLDKKMVQENANGKMEISTKDNFKIIKSTGRVLLPGLQRMVENIKGMKNNKMNGKGVLTWKSNY